jgi:outer membrane receptor protein involved in Fe transport
VGGIFQQRQIHNILQDYIVDGFSDQASVTGWNDTLWLTDQQRVDRDFALFGEVTWNISKQLSLTGGLRHFWSRNSLFGFYGYSEVYSPAPPDGSGTGEASCTTAPVIGGGFNGAPCDNLNAVVAQKGNTPKANLTYKITDDKLIYATFSKGFRPGGVNRRGGFPPYKPDYLTNYEIGWKTSWANNRLRFNGAVFDEEWKDFQFSYLGTNSLTIVTNASGARIRGIESSLEFAVTNGLKLSAGGTYLDPKLTKPFCKDVTLSYADCALPANNYNYAASGTTLPVTPKFKGNVTIRNEFGLGDYAAFTQAAFAYQTSSRSALIPAEQAALGTQGAYGILDLSAGIQRDNHSYELYVNNATNKHADLYRYSECTPLQLNYFPNPGAPFCDAKSYDGTNQPLTIGVKYTRSF